MILEPTITFKDEKGNRYKYVFGTLLYKEEINGAVDFIPIHLTEKEIVETKVLLQKLFTNIVGDTNVQ